jgi:hypothetical protein
MRTAAAPFALALALTGCAPANPWVEATVEGVALSDLQVVRTGWDQGREAEPGADGQARYTWVMDIQNGSTTIWSGQVRIIAELEAGGQVFSDTINQRVVVPGRRTITVRDFGRMPGEVETGGLMPRFKVRIGSWCAEVHRGEGSAAVCPEEPAAAPPTDMGPPIR